MRRVLWCLVALCCAATVAMAGPNAGGVLVVHDCACFDSCDPPPPPCPAPASCAAVDNNIAPSPSPAASRVWKVYAAFPTGSSPRLTSLAWGIDLMSEGYVYVIAAGLPDPPNMYQVVEGSWPTPSPGASIAESFAITQTANLVECYWFAGYGYQGGEFATVPHASHDSVFMDDADQADPIEGFSTIGFGQPGTTVCPPPMGACCSGPTCAMRSQAGCAAIGGVWQGESTSCLPNPCGPPIGACCHMDGSCTSTTQVDCDYVWYGPGHPCVPNPCTGPAFGACCAPEGTCTITLYNGCAAPNVWQGPNSVCTPNPCPQPTGACCESNGDCQVTFEWECPTGVWFMFVTCPPNPCSPPQGSCCYPDGNCVINYQFDCSGTWTVFGVCSPNPCEQPTGACCYPPYDLCIAVTHAECDSLNGMYLGDFTTCVPAPCPVRGACCFPTGECSLLYHGDCTDQGGVYQGDAHPCEPNLCPPPTPTERTSWGQIKNLYR